MNSFVSTSKEPDSKTWLLHLPSQTLAEFLPAMLPDGAHLLMVQADFPPADEVFQSFVEAVEHLQPEGSANLTMETRANGQTLPEFIILVNLVSIDVVIHYPHIGFSAGIRADGSKSPPIWKNPEIFGKEERSVFLEEAANRLMGAIASGLQSNR